MSQIFDESGKVIQGTVVSAGPVYVTNVKTGDKDKYEAVQVAYGDRKEKNIAKPQKTIAKLNPKEGFGFQYLREFRVKGDKSEIKEGDVIDVSVFEEGDKVVVSGISKAKGFQGVVKRHGFKGGRRSHGQKHSEREPGSIGATGPQRVFKGLRMAGRMGGDRVSVKNLKIAKIDKENNQIFIAGAIPGRKGTLIEIVAN